MGDGETAFLEKLGGNAWVPPAVLTTSSVSVL